MSKLLQFSVLLFAACVMFSSALIAEEGVRGNLVDVHWLQKNLKNPDVVLLDVSPETYSKNHIPGAISTNARPLSDCRAAKLRMSMLRAALLPR